METKPEAECTETRQVRIFLPIELHRRIRHLAVDEGLPIREMVVRLLESTTDETR